jgi:hypothetical protein
LRTGTSAAAPTDQNAGSHGRPQDHAHGTSSGAHGLRHDEVSQNPSDLWQNSPVETQPARGQIIINNSGQNSVPIQPAIEEQPENHTLDTLSPNGVAIQPANAAIVIAVDPNRDRSVKRRLRGIHLFVCINADPTVLFALHS